MNTKFLVIVVLFFGAFSVDAGINPKNLKKLKDRAKLQGSRMDCQPSQAQYDLEINNVRARLLAGGDLWWNLQDGRYIVPKPAPGFPEVSAIFASGIWMGGVDPNGALKLAGVTYRQGNNTDFYSGPLNEDGQTSNEVCSDWDRHFVVKGDNILEHRKRYQEANSNGSAYPCDSIPEDVKYWPARGNPFFGEKYSFPLPDQNLADFWDEDGDGIYNACDGDFPILDSRGCELEKLIPDEIVFWIFNDNGGPHRLTQASAIQMEVQAQAFAYATQDELNDMTFYRYELINKASDDIRDCYFGLWTDPDLGCPVDDFIGCDVNRSMAYVYNEDSVDGNPGSSCPNGGGVNTYGDNIPILGIDLFRGPRGPKVFCGVDNEGNQILCDPAPGSGAQDTLVELGMSSFTYQNNSGNNAPPATQDPQIDFEFYNILKGLWIDGTAITFGNTGFDPLSTDTTKYVFSDPPNDDNGWSMCTANLPFDDRRMVQATGPLLLQPGAKNEMIFGVVFVPNANYPCPEIRELQFVDDLAQALFDNCFNILEKPDAPDMAAVELDKKLILLLSNATSLSESNNAKLQYKQKDLSAPSGVDDPYYRFEGYKIYQLADAGATTQELDDIDKARLVRQVDLKNGVDEIYNWFSIPNPDPGSSELIWIPERQVDGADEGIRHSFEITKDAFDLNNQELINGKEYFYTVVAYAYNNYMQYSPSDNVGQRTPYIESGGNVRSYSFTPKSQTNTVIPTTYGQEAAVTRIEGIGTSFNALDMADGEIESILDGTFDGIITYKPGNGPINPKVVDPLNIRSGEYRLEIVGGYNDSLSNLKAIRPGARWLLTDLSSGEVIASERTIEEINEQVIPEMGFSIEVSQVGDPGDQFDENNGAIAQGYVYENESGTDWWNAIPAYTGVQVTSGGSTEFLFPFVEMDQDDPNNALSQIDDGFFNPIKTSKWEQTETPFITPAWKTNQGFAIVQNKLRLKDLNNVDIVFTSDKSKWSKCIVVESAVQDYEDNGLITRGERVQFDLRSDRSIDENGNEIDGTGMSYFPGYAIDVETGERLNIFFGENSAFSPENDEMISQTSGNPVNSGGIGTDMIWNPSTDLFLGGDPVNSPIGSYNNIVGGQHYIYVTRQEYDGCNAFSELLNQGGLLNKIEAVSFVTWTAIPTPKAPLLALSEGLIPNDLTVKLRVTNPYNKELDSPDNSKANLFEAVGGLPLYEFGFKDVETTTSTNEEPQILDDFTVSPNPFYENGQGEQGNTVRIANLPKGAVVTIYTMDGSYVNRFSEEGGSDFIASESKLALEWNLNNNGGVRVPEGVYVINVAVPSLGIQKSVKWIKI